MTGIRVDFETDAVSGPPVSVFTVFHAKLGQEHSLLYELRQLVRATRQESGCLLFDLFRISGDPLGFALSEVWQDREASRSHQEAFHTRRFEIAASPFLEKLQDT